MLGGWGTVKFGGEPNPEYQIAFSESQLLAFSFARPVAPGNNIQRGRWYIEPGIGAVGYNSDGVVRIRIRRQGRISRRHAHVRPRRPVRARPRGYVQVRRVDHPAAPAREQQHVGRRSVRDTDRRQARSQGRCHLVSGNAAQGTEQRTDEPALRARVADGRKRDVGSARPSRSRSATTCGIRFFRS